MTPTDGYREVDSVEQGEELLRVLELAAQFPARQDPTLDPERSVTKIIERAQQRRQASDNQAVNGG